ncbi:MAG: AGE family epimerase/isomerase [Commensalibacter sp.]|nr:AGE family epimerase/isomerase [Commensalibacter sp.]
MPVPPSVKNLYQVFSSWLFDQAFPLWGSIGCDGTEKHPSCWGAHEQLTLDGKPDLTGYKRMRVQARQLYAFTQASFMGWSKGNAIAESIYHFMQNGQQGEGWWARRLTREGKILDPTADLYDLAFIIFSFAWYGRLTGDPKPIHQARQTIRWIQQYMAFPKGGFKNTLPLEKGYRQQNPHMHLLEATLALYETTGSEQDLVFVQQLIALFKNYFFDLQRGNLGEYFTENWQSPPGKAGDEIEPGHQYEWIWLLAEYNRLVGGHAMSEAIRMYEFNRRFAVDKITGLVFNKVKRDGSFMGKSVRLWVQTEAIRATSLMDDEKSYNHLAQIIYNLLYRFFALCPSGTWRDQFNDRLQFCDNKIPTSSFYHIVSGFVQLGRVMGYPRYPQVSPQFTESNLSKI